MAEHWKHVATRCAVPGCDAQRVKGWTTCKLIDHYADGMSLYDCYPRGPRLMSEACPGNGDCLLCDDDHCRNIR